MAQSRNTIWLFLTATFLSQALASIPTIKWQNCSTSTPHPLDCENIQVPIDWTDPESDQVTLRMVRHNATSPSKRLGSLIVNPGGPGSPASTVVTYAPYAFGADILTHFDIIGLDPRGLREPHRPSHRAPGLRVSIAMDIEAVRIALGDDKLTDLGLSYGTVLGAQYAQLFPGNIRAMALDGNVDHNMARTYSLTPSSAAHETGLIRFSQWCAQNSTCALHGTDVLQLFDDLVAQADETPLPAPVCAVSGICRSDVTGEELRDNLRNWLPFKDPPPQLLLTGWNDLAFTLAQAKSGNATLLSTPLATDPASILFPELAIYCLDWSRDTSVADVKYKQDNTATLMPHTQGVCEVNIPQVQCIGWPVPVENREHNASSNNTLPILLVNVELDPLTPMEWVVGQREQIRESVLLTRRGDGHTSYFLFGETSRAIDAYLVGLELPGENVVLDS
ncbi:hypothetical protein BO70DRAFT_379645 [Aspergillus heteromorphus CBS 117.55]|uniref:Alpha/beta-hydrolase n=1 Tax=Aspergillus heteromorphus CBS 117.55 TaxID=1448321 RepID=A0A317W9X4_9EURO|nr:uncharacterized protein BO70DRAFT_379645 [Aspergillus heteromorphus CBS 117.55]PWY82112.1 hypothetical protein BO70DRAFT_379645 [Aspergillus heteromorphus CBS 117.55]